MAGSILVFVVATACVALLAYNKIRARPVLIPAVWAMGALLPAIRGRLPARFLGLTAAKAWLSIKYYALTTLILFPLYMGGVLLWEKLGGVMPQERAELDVSAVQWVAYQFAFVAFFEELFFRGYLQGQAERLAAARFPAGRMARWAPVAASAFLFAAAHVLIDLDPTRFAVFFPGLLFAWLRTVTGSLLAPVLSHGTANVFALYFMNCMSQA